MLMNCCSGVRITPQSHHDANREVGVASVITPLSIWRGDGGEAVEEIDVRLWLKLG